MRYLTLLFLLLSLISCKTTSLPQHQGRINDPQQLIKLTQSAEAGNSQAQMSLANHFFKGENTPKTQLKALEWLEKAAYQNYGPALTQLGLLYETGQHVRQDNSKAATLYKRAVDQNYAPAMNNLAYLHKTASGVAFAPDKAIALYKHAITLKNTRAMLIFGHMHLHGLLMPQNTEEAFHFFKMAADLKDPDGLYQLGLIHELGETVPQNLQLAWNYYQQAAKLGDKRAEKRLSYLTALKNTQKSHPYYVEAAKLLKKRVTQSEMTEISESLLTASDLGHPLAQYKLGLIYYNNPEIKDDYLTAEKFLSLAAKQYNMQAMTLLGFLYADSISPLYEPDKAIDLLTPVADMDLPITYSVLSFLHVYQLAPQNKLLPIYIKKGVQSGDTLSLLAALDLNKQNDEISNIDTDIFQNAYRDISQKAHLILRGYENERENIYNMPLPDLSFKEE